MEQLQVDIDLLEPQRSHIDLADKNIPTDFGLDDYLLSSLMDDVMLIEFCDIESGDDGCEYVMRRGLAIPTTQVHNLWRKGVVILKGPRVRFAKEGDIVVFPSNLGIPVTNIEVEGHGVVDKGLFLNEQRMFGVAKKRKKDDN